MGTNALANLNEMMNSPLAYYGAIASVVIGVVLLLVGAYMKKKKINGGYYLFY